MTASRTASPTPPTGGGTQSDAVGVHCGGRSGTQWDAVKGMDRHDAYRQFLCVDCKTVRYSPGRPRCNDCHADYMSASSKKNPCIEGEK